MATTSNLAGPNLSLALFPYSFLKYGPNFTQHVLLSQGCNGVWKSAQGFNGVEYTYHHGDVWRSSGGDVLGVLDHFLHDIADAPRNIDHRPRGRFCGEVRRWPLDLNREEINQVCDCLREKSEANVECILQHYVFVVRGRIMRLAQLLRDMRIGGALLRLPAAIVSMILEMGDVHLLLELTEVQMDSEFQSHAEVQIRGGCSAILQEIMQPLFGAEIKLRGVLLPKISETEHFCTATKSGAGYLGTCNWPFDLDHTDYQMVSRTMETVCGRRYDSHVQDMMQHYKELLRIRIEQVARILYTKFPANVVCKILVFGSETILRHDLIRIQILHNYRPPPLETIAAMQRMLLLPVCGQIFVKQPLPARKYQPVETPGGPEDEDEGDDPQGLHSEQDGEGS